MNAKDLHTGYNQSEPDVHFSVNSSKQQLTVNDRIFHDLEADPAYNTTKSECLNHCHTNEDDKGIDKRAQKKLIIASVLCLFFMIGEAVGGAIASSLAIMTDAAHLLTDFASFMISLLAIFLAAQPATKKMSFGWHRAEVVGALVSVLMIWLVTGILVYMAIRRIIDDDFNINGRAMLITSALGVGVNILMAATLHQHGHSHGGGGSHGHSHGFSVGSSSTPDRSHSHSHSHGSGDGANHSHNHSHAIAHDDQPKLQNGGPLAGSYLPAKATSSELNSRGNSSEEDVHLATEAAIRAANAENINVRAAFIHVIGDLLQSLGVFIAAMVIYFKPHLKIADPICTFLFSALVLFTTINILRDAMVVLMEGTPSSLDFDDVKAALNATKGVVEVHNLRLWSLTTSKPTVSAHLAIDNMSESMDVLRRSTQMLRTKYLIYDVTVQLEQYLPEMAECRRCREPIK